MLSLQDAKSAMEPEPAPADSVEHLSHAQDATPDKDIVKNATELALTTEKENHALNAKLEKEWIIKAAAAQILTESSLNHDTISPLFSANLSAISKTIMRDGFINIYSYLYHKIIVYKYRYYKDI